MRQSSKFTDDTKLDFLFAFPGGMDSGIAPLLLPKTQLAYASNSTVRGTFVSPRAPWNKRTLVFNGGIENDVLFGLFQGSCFYLADSSVGGAGSLIASISGRLFQFIPSLTDLTVQVFERTGGNPQDPTVPQCWLWQAENYVIWNDGVNPPVFFNGTTNTTARSGGTNLVITTTAGSAFFMPTVGNSFQFDVSGPGIVNGNDYLLAQYGSFHVTNVVGLHITATNLSISSGQFYAPPMDILSADTTIHPQFPPGKMGAYGLGRIWMSLANGRNFMAGDIVGGPSGTSANNFRDAILNITENQFLFGGGQFTIPASGETITAMVFATELDKSLGQGPLQVFTQTRVFSCQAPVDRTTWTTVENPILTQSLIGQGALGQNSTICSNGDVIFRSLVGLGSLILARREFATWGNVPISREMQRTIDTDPQALLQFGSAVNFDNRLLMTTHPTFSARGTAHRGAVVINYDPLSNLHGKAPSVWDGTWPGHRDLSILQLNTGKFDSVERSFNFMVNTSTNQIEFWEFLRSHDSQFADNLDADPIFWFFESPMLKFAEETPDQRTLKVLVDGEIYVDKLQGRVLFEAFYRPDQYPCWIPWLTWEECAQNNPANPPGVFDQPQFRPRMGLGSPDIDQCDPNTKRAFPYGYAFQFKLQVTGHCEFLGAKFKATPAPEDTFAPRCTPICTT